MSKETPMGELRQWCEARAGECGTKAEDPAIAERLQLGWAMSADAFACVIEKIDDMDPANASPPDHEPGERSTIEEKLSPEQQVLIWRIGERIAIWRIGERIADEVEKVAAGRQSDCEAAAGEIYAMLTATAKAEESSAEAPPPAASGQAKWYREGELWTPPDGWQAIHDAISEYGSKGEHLYTDVEKVFALHTVNLADAICAALSVEAVKRAAYQEGWNDREADLIAGVSRIAPQAEARSEQAEGEP